MPASGQSLPICKGGLGFWNPVPTDAGRRGCRVISRTPAGKQINHLCNRPYCVQPTHIYAGDQQDNKDDSKIFGFSGFMPPPSIILMNPEGELTDPLLRRLRTSERWKQVNPWKPPEQPPQVPLEEFTCPGHKLGAVPPALVGQLSQEAGDAGFGQSSCQSPVAHHAPYIQVLGHHQARRLGYRRCRLVMNVVPHVDYAGMKPPPPGIQPLPAIAGSVLPWTFLDRAMAWSSLLRRPRASLNALGVKGGGKMGHVSGMVAKLPAGGVSPSTPPIPVLAIPLGERDQGNREAGQKHLTPMVQTS